MWFSNIKRLITVVISRYDKYNEVEDKWVPERGESVVKFELRRDGILKFLGLAKEAAQPPGEGGDEKFEIWKENISSNEPHEPELENLILLGKALYARRYAEELGWWGRRRGGKRRKTKRRKTTRRKTTRRKTKRRKTKGRKTSR